MTLESPARPPAEKRRRLDRVTTACDFCKKRKVKCNGEYPCTYCIRKKCADTCTFTNPKRAGEPSDGTRQRNHASNVAGPGSSPTIRQEHSTLQENPAGNVAGLGSSPTVSRDGFHHEDTVVPREGRILRDAEGKFIFIGDCAPLSFLQTVRYLVASEADSDGFTAQVSRDSIIEFSRPDPESRIYDIPVTADEASATIEEYLIATCGLVDLFERDELLKEIGLWARGNTSHSDDAVTAVLFLVLAIGSQEQQTRKSEAWSKHAKDLLLKHMCSSMNVATVQGFALLAIYMLRAFQPNGAYLYFSLAARTAYAIGIHRTEVNASFGPSMRRMRDRIWKSLRVVDMLISSQIGRPPCTSDVDCTVKYGVSGKDGDTTPDILDASVQIFMIIEQVVVQVYSRKRISLRIADYVSRQLKNWAVKWLQALSDRTRHPEAAPLDTVVGACSTLCSYYYGIMLLTRPFLIYELYEYIGASMRGGGTQSDHLKKRQYADAALDAAASLVETLESVIVSHRMPRRMPLIVSWLFTASLALAVGILGRSGLTFERNCEASIRCLEYFGEADPHARQYSFITRSLLSNTTRHVKKREQQLRAQCKQASSNLFGMLSSDPEQSLNEPYEQRQRFATSSVHPERTERTERTNPTSTAPIDWTIYDSDFFATSWSSNEYDQGLQDFLQPGAYNLDGASVADIPLFPIYDQQMGSGHAP